MDILSPVINGYVYGLPDDGRAVLLRDYAQLIGKAHAFNTFVSTDPQFYPNATTTATQIYDIVNTILTDIYSTAGAGGTSVVPFNRDVAVTLAPPGNTWDFTLGGQAGSSVTVASKGVVWNLWAMGLQQLVGSSVDANNVWNNSYAQGIALPTSAQLQDSPALINSFTGVPPDPLPDATTNPYTNYIKGFTTVPFVTVSNPGGVYPPWAVTNITGGAPAGSDYRLPTLVFNDLQYKNFLVQAIYDFRNIAPDQLQTAVQNIVGGFTWQGITYAPATILKQPALQDTLFFDYALTGEGQLQRQLGATTDLMRITEDVLTALNLIQQTISADVTVDYNLNASGASLLPQASGLMSGFSMLRMIFNSGRIQGTDRINMIQSLLKLAKPAASQLIHNVPGAETTLATWWKGNTSSNLNNNAIAQWQNQNETLQQQLKKAIFIYQEFVQSASTILRKLNQVVVATAKGIKGS